MSSSGSDSGASGETIMVTTESGSLVATKNGAMSLEQLDALQEKQKAELDQINEQYNQLRASSNPYLASDLVGKASMFNDWNQLVKMNKTNPATLDKLDFSDFVHKHGWEELEAIFPRTNGVMRPPLAYQSSGALLRQWRGLSTNMQRLVIERIRQGKWKHVTLVPRIVPESVPVQMSIPAQNNAPVKMPYQINRRKQRFRGKDKKPRKKRGPPKNPPIRRKTRHNSNNPTTSAVLPHRPALTQELPPLPQKFLQAHRARARARVIEAATALTRRTHQSTINTMNSSLVPASNIPRLGTDTSINMAVLPNSFKKSSGSFPTPAAAAATQQMIHAQNTSIMQQQQELVSAAIGGRSSLPFQPLNRFLSNIEGSRKPSTASSIPAASHASNLTVDDVDDTEEEETKEDDEEFVMSSPATSDFDSDSGTDDSDTKDRKTGDLDNDDDHDIDGDDYVHNSTPNSNSNNRNPHDGAKIIMIPSGRLGITVKFRKEGAILDEIHSHCPFKDDINVGDCIATVNGIKPTAPDDFSDQKSSFLRRLLIIPKETKEVAAIADNLMSSVDYQNHTAHVGKRTGGGGDLAMASPAKKMKQAIDNYPDALDNMKQEKQKEAFNEWHASWQKYQKHDITGYTRDTANDGWEYRCRQIQQYKQEQDCDDGDINNIPLDYSAPDDMTFGDWVSEQQKLHYEDKLPSSRVEYLKNQGLDLNYTPPRITNFTGDDQWDDKFLEMIEYRKTHGTCEVPITYPAGETLGQWVKKQRDQYLAGTLDKDRHQFLEEKGFLFEPGTNVQKSVIDPFWLKSFGELKQYGRDHGNLSVPVGYKASSISPCLHVWIKTQRAQYRWKELSIHKIKLLEEVGLDLTAFRTFAATERALNDKWEKKFNELVEYRNVHGDCLVQPSHLRLHEWVRRQRKLFNKNALKPERLHRLLSIGFDFDPRNRNPHLIAKISDLPLHDESEEPERDLSIFNNEHWTHNYEGLKRFKETTGHISIDPEYKDERLEGSLWTWLETQKSFFEKNQLPSRNIELLEALGVDLSKKGSYDKKSWDVSWEHTLKSLKRFHDIVGHGNVPLKYREVPEDMDEAAPKDDDAQAHLPFCGDRHLGSWLSRQRKIFQKGKLSEERRIALENLGVDLTLEAGKGRPRTLGRMPNDDIWFVHKSADGDPIKRRVPIDWKFPNLHLEHMYIFYHVRHCITKEIMSPMKLFQRSDMFAKNDDLRLMEVKHICYIIDHKCRQEGVRIKEEMTVADAKRCFSIGCSALKALKRTSTERRAGLYAMSWSDFAKLERKSRYGTKDGPTPPTLW